MTNKHFKIQNPKTKHTHPHTHDWKKMNNNAHPQKKEKKMKPITCGYNSHTHDQKK